MMVPVLLAHMVDPSEVQHRKKTVRREILARRDALDPTVRATASLAIANQVVARASIGATIALYASFGSEVDTTPLDGLLRARGHRVAYPRVVAGTRVLAFQLTSSIDELVPTGRLQIREPSGPPIALADIAMFVVPGVAFDARGARLGYGRGHYDTTLAALTADLVGIAFDCQLVPAGIDEAHDIHMHAVVTERMTYARTVT